MVENIPKPKGIGGRPRKKKVNEVYTGLLDEDDDVTFVNQDSGTVHGVGEASSRIVGNVGEAGSRTVGNV
nr:hypothetical protein [Tanacetum cinerariifolium]